MMDLPGRQNLNPAPTRPVATVNKNARRRVELVKLELGAQEDVLQ